MCRVGYHAYTATEWLPSRPDNQRPYQLMYIQTIRWIGKWLGEKVGTHQSLGRIAVGTSCELNQPPRSGRPGGSHRQPRSGCLQASADRQSFGAVGEEIDIDLAAYTMGPANSADLEQPIRHGDQSAGR